MGGGQTLLVGLRNGRPHFDYWGAALPAGARETLDARLLERAIPHGMLDGGERLDLLPESGHGFMATPALKVSRAHGGFVTQMAVQAAHVADDACQIRLADAAAGVEVLCEIRLDPATGVASFQLELRNAGLDALRVDWASPVAFPSLGDEILAFGGRWAREFAGRRLRLPSGLWASEARTGRTSHHSPPFLVIGEPGFGEHHGQVLAVHLAWSGDHRLFAERLRDGRIQVQAGELFWPGEVVLAPGEAYRSPIVYAAKSDVGLNGLSARLHAFVRGTVLGGRLTGRPRPVHFNTWEAVYFRHDEDELKRLAEAAASVGAERFVLDDGWFKGRDDDTTSLGDWTPDPGKYPQGLGPLVAHVRGLGLEFGLWVEPEMANACSDLLHNHPDWILGEPGRDQPLGRGQYVLDLTRPEVSAAIFSALDRLLREHPIAYLKWDMNRDLTHPVSGGFAASRNQVLAVYALMDRVRAAHPGVEIESCASGGGRADYEVLKRTDRIWTSDCNDPLERQSIQQAFSIFFPPEVMGAHVGPADSHTTARRASIELRTLTALFGHMGIEADVRRFAPAELEVLRTAIALHKRFRPLLHGGRLVRQTPPDPGAVSFAVLGEGEALASLAQLATPETAAAAPLRLKGLDHEMIYTVRLLNPPGRPEAAMKHAPALVRGEAIRAAGRLIAELGLPAPILRAGEIAVYHLEAKRG
ncbi:alpha-galactosidase [Phenylobacterium sp. J367]|uniref:alpha-galactosidase n=1 Tax=Phenylobacterium sp. J367 TaxID=2898435 RepID=UPI002151D6FA|nr:alpha-galactosidase [Phenylobacterium sp. J367]MCR5879262.1 alpha-galactosidase [Phenylobacterium sp. J367]